MRQIRQTYYVLSIAILLLLLYANSSCTKKEEPKQEVPLSTQQLLESTKELKTAQNVPTENNKADSKETQHKSKETESKESQVSNSSPHKTEGASSHSSSDDIHQKAENVHKSESGETRHTAEIVVPDSVKGKWESVKLTITDKQTKKSQAVNVKLGSEYKVHGSKLTIKVGDFLPDFKMDALTITSMSNETKNPAVIVTVKEEDKEIFKGWLYSKYPEIHPFEHDRYGVILMEGIKTN
ncbi:MAG: DUF2155 domain-containing protein [Nitrospirae bacterium]|nr:DUF2155 domain-containing protein [Nitrospirota bacterium]